MIRHEIKQKLTQIYNRLPLPAWILLGLFLLFSISYGLIFGIHKQVAFSYAGETCVRQFIFGPSTLQQTNESGYVVEVKEVTSIGNVQLFATSLCFTPTKTPTVGANMVTTSPFGSWFAAKSFSVTVPEAPVANTQNLINSTVPTTRALKIALSGKDEVFNYALIAGDKKATCDHKDAAINCDVPSLNLDQGASYDVSLERHFEDKKVATLATGKVTTLLPIQQTAASVSEAQVVYDKPAQLAFTYDKELQKGDAVLKKQVGDIWEVVQTTVKTNGKTLEISPAVELSRKTQFELTIQHAEAKDGSALDGPTVVRFSTSGGPKVTGVSVASYGISQAGIITITLDQEVANVNKIPEFVTAQGADIQVTKAGNTLRLNYSGAAFCSPITLSVKKGLESAAGIVGDEDWGFATRTICHTSRTIGTSTKGRAIVAHTYGSGSKTILYTGSIHGNEHSSRLLMNAWMNELETSPGNIPAGTRIIVIPSVNPDGQAANTRTNARNVDLNRNFNVSDWKKDIQTVGGQPFPGGGGEAPESEAETKVLVNFTKEVAPHLTLSYHSQAAYAIANGCGNSAALAAKYAQLSGYRNMTGNGSAFSYEITGTYDDWLCEKQGRQSVLLELASSSNAEFSRNKAAMWEMARS
ncbi:MAG: M14 family metallopeptidase [Patescibacteria group bacterium]